MKVFLSLFIRYSTLILMLCFSLLIFSCKNKNAKPPLETDTPTSGTLNISADESFAPLVNDEINSFESLYPKAKINARFKSESGAVTDLLNNGTKEIIISRKLTDNELTYFSKDKAPVSIQIGYDAVVFFLNKENSDSNIHYEQIADILKGKISNWKELNTQSSLGNITIIFDNTRSGIFRFLKEGVLKGDTISSSIFAVDSNAAVFTYVENHSAAIGVVGVSWISSVGDTVAQSLLSKIRVVGISKPDSVTGIFYHPYRAELMRRQYPFLRELYIISHEDYAGLGTGFASYVTSDEGQTVIERSGLIPATQPERVIMLRNEF